MLRRQIALGYGEQAGQPRLGSQQVVAAFVELVLLDPVADRQKLRSLRKRKEKSISKAKRRVRSRNDRSLARSASTALSSLCASWTCASQVASSLAAQSAMVSLCVDAASYG